MDNFANTYVEAPVSSDSGVYPYNRIERSVSGHQFEIDDTVGAERIKRTHCKGTYEEWDASGNSTRVIHGRDYTLVMDDKDLIVNGKVNIIVNGECNTTVSGDYNITVGGNMNINVQGSVRRRINGNDYTETTGDYAYNTGANYKIIVEDDMVQKIKGDNDIKIQGKNDVLIGDLSSVQMNSHNVTQVSGMTVLTSGEKINFGTPEINLSASGTINAHAGSTNFVAGNVNVKQSVIADVEVTAKSINLTTHKHGGVYRGGVDTFEPK